jgi:hypothetical protein
MLTVPIVSGDRKRSCNAADIVVDAEDAAINQPWCLGVESVA